MIWESGKKKIRDLKEVEYKKHIRIDGHDEILSIISNYIWLVESRLLGRIEGQQYLRTAVTNWWYVRSKRLATAVLEHTVQGSPLLACQ